MEPAGRGHHQPVAAHLAQHLALDRVGQLGHPPVWPAVEGDVVHGHCVARRRCGHQPGQLHHVELAGQRAPKPSSRSLGLDRGQEADRAVVDGEHGHVAAGEAAQAGQDRAVAAQDQRQVGVGRRGRRRAPRPRAARSRACPPPRSGRRTSTPFSRASSRSTLERRLHVLLSRWVKTVITRAGRLMARPSAPRPPGLRPHPRRPASASQTKLSRLPAGPGRPEEA